MWSFTLFIGQLVSQFDPHKSCMKIFLEIVGGSLLSRVQSIVVYRPCGFTTFTNGENVTEISVATIQNMDFLLEGCTERLAPTRSVQ